MGENEMIFYRMDSDWYLDDKWHETKGELGHKDMVISIGIIRIVL